MHSCPLIPALGRLRHLCHLGELLVLKQWALLLAYVARLLLINGLLAGVWVIYETNQPPLSVRCSAVGVGAQACFNGWSGRAYGRGTCTQAIRAKSRILRTDQQISTITAAAATTARSTISKYWQCQSRTSVGFSCHNASKTAHAADLNIRYHFATYP